MSEVRVFPGWSGWGAAAGELEKLLPGAVVAELGVAFEAAAGWHRGQVRPAGEVYEQHLLQVVDVLAQGLGVTDVDLLRAGLLHDVVEDTDGTIQELAARFGERTAGLVGAVTIGPEGRTAYLDKLAHAPRDVLLLKLSDRYSNVQRLHTHPRVAKQRSYYAETVEHFVPLAVVDERLEELYTAWAAAYSYLEGPVDTVEAADKLAAAVHREQVDKSGEPYVLHVRGAAEIARREGADEHQQMAALLHDSVEDTCCTLEQLTELGVPPQVVEMVDALTRRPGETHDDYLTRLVRTPAAVPVKRADIEHNSSPARQASLDPATQERLRAKYAYALEVIGTSGAGR
ncbi:HD domain-containing protein [Kribbella sp.]|uniref:HD domain-containing protein n=1 Tax=Kribbella sp. TaxID=1871183 RepID=UPI002D3F7662|nr:HD domain-containing protein [Kribbella sp.]HZX09005.1 HD domain-containing protein [Kribbella sp.]